MSIKWEELNPMQKAVLEWHIAFGVIVNTKPTIPDLKVKELRKSLIAEEQQELFKAIDEDNIIEIADGIGDLLVVLFGTAISYGINMQPIFDEIQRSNMSKIWPDGEVHYNDLGKVMKPSTYSPANLKPILDLQAE